MYLNITIFDVTDVKPKCCGKCTTCVPNGYIVYDTDKKEYETPHREEFVVRNTEMKPSVYKRDFMQCRKTKYDYAFTEKVTRTTTTEKDVYYNRNLDKFYTTTPKRNTTVKTEYSLPSLIVF